jgi:hypothetical protein
METYIYVNIFETKGLEYLIILSYFGLFVVFVRYYFLPKSKNNKQ